MTSARVRGAEAYQLNGLAVSLAVRFKMGDESGDSSPDGLGRLETWEASDLNTEHLEKHCGQILRQVGVDIRKRDVFQLFQDAALTPVPSVVIIACIYPPWSLQNQMDGILAKYLRGRRVSNQERRLLYDSMAFESAAGQLPNGTIVSISRRSDCIRATCTPAAVMPLKAAPGYTPTQ